MTLAVVKAITLNECGVVWYNNDVACGKKENHVNLL